MRKKRIENSCGFILQSEGVQTAKGHACEKVSELLFFLLVCFNEDGQVISILHTQPPETLGAGEGGMAAYAFFHSLKKIGIIYGV